MVLAQNPVSSRVLDAFLESPTVALKDRRRLILAFVEHFHILMTDRVGSRVGDRLWEAADPYLQVSPRVLYFIAQFCLLIRSLVGTDWKISFIARGCPPRLTIRQIFCEKRKPRSFEAKTRGMENVASAETHCCKGENCT